MIGQSAAFKCSLTLIQKFSTCDACVLLQGETGTGKELFARAIHYMSQRRDYPFVAINCGALPETLIESELFGNEQGAYTDAREARSGLITEAEGGTLFLDEIDSMPKKTQISLLRFLQDQTFRRLGSRREQKGNVRIIAAASNYLSHYIEQGQFRIDLAYRLGVLDLTLPPLRDRPGDPALLAEHFIHKYADKYNTKPKQLSPESINWIDRYDWPGNVRELENKIHRGLIISDDFYFSITPDKFEDKLPASKELPEKITSMDFNQARRRVLNEFEKQYVTEALRKTSGNVTQAAQIANKERRAFGKLIKKHQIDRIALIVNH
jgi:transcriptional regulator with PAS, ATPase and Fis domain